MRKKTMFLCSSPHGRLSSSSSSSSSPSSFLSIITYYASNTYFLITNKQRKNSVRDGTARPRILQPRLGGRIFNHVIAFVFRVHFAMDEFELAQNSRQTIAKLESKVFQNQIYEGERAGLTVFTEKLNVKVLPCLILFKMAMPILIVGFEELGNKDDYKTMALEKRMLDAGNRGGREGYWRRREKDEQIEQRADGELSNRRMKRVSQDGKRQDSDFD